MGSRSLRISWALAGCLVYGIGTNGRGSEPDPLDAHIEQAGKVLGERPNDKQAWRARALLYAAAGNYSAAIADYDKALALDPLWAEMFDERGSLRFMAGQIGPSIEDFDRFVKLRPDREPWHWKRGISYYYAGRFDDGRRQFEAYQTQDDNDVENAVWRYLCMARSDSVPAARRQILKIKRDTRVPMSEVYQLYSGTLAPEAVLEAARAGSPSPEALNSRLFYAHLYLGLYFETEGDLAAARPHIAAATQHRIGHYMWNVADVHHKLLERTAAGEKP